MSLVKPRGKEELSLRHRISGGSTGLRTIANFVIQQFLATVGVLLTAMATVWVASPLVQSFDPTFQPNWLLAEIHFFPVQLLVGFACGYRLAPRFETRAGLWVWLIPLASLLYAMSVFAPVSVFDGSAARISHFIGTSCDVRQRCFDQLTATAPFYAASAYSLGMLAGRGRSRIKFR